MMLPEEIIFQKPSFKSAENNGSESKTANNTLLEEFISSGCFNKNSNKKQADLTINGETLAFAPLTEAASNSENTNLSKEEIETLVEELEGPTRNIRNSASSKLAAVGTQALKPLLTAVQIPYCTGEVIMRAKALIMPIAKEHKQTSFTEWQDTFEQTDRRHSLDYRSADLFLKDLKRVEGLSQSQLNKQVEVLEDLSTAVNLESFRVNKEWKVALTHSFSAQIKDLENLKSSLESISCVNLNNKISQANENDLSTLKQLPNLKELCLGEGQISDAGMAHLSSLNKLVFLRLTDTEVSDKGLEAIKNLTNLEYVWLGRTKISDNGLTQLEGLSKLKVLDLKATLISDNGIETISKLNSLEHLDLANTAITDNAIEHLVKLSNLKTLQIASTKISAQGIETLKKALPKCQLTFYIPN